MGIGRRRAAGIGRLAVGTKAVFVLDMPGAYVRMPLPAESDLPAQVMQGVGFSVSVPEGLTR
jgi:hypothetical protein